MNKLLVITNSESDLLNILKAHLAPTVISTEDRFCGDDYDAVCVLLGNGPAPLTLSAPLQVEIDKMRIAGKAVFLEFVSCFSLMRLRKSESTDRQRMVYSGENFPLCSLSDGDLLDGQSNTCIKYAPLPEGAEPILSYQEYVCAHSRCELDKEAHREGSWALWRFDKVTLISSIRLSNFNRARFAPRDRWQEIIKAIVAHIAGEAVDISFPAPVQAYIEEAPKSYDDMLPTINRAIDWIYSCGLLKDGGKGGFQEGFTNLISAKDGKQGKNSNIRTDCTLEIAGALYLNALLYGDEKNRDTAELMIDFAFDYLQVKDGEHKGMLRWSELAFETCFQDDAARAIIPLLLVQHSGAKIPHLDDILSALDYMVASTSDDGIRVPCTEMYGMTAEYIEKIKPAGSAEPCAHFNAYYHAALLLAYKATGKKEYLDVARCGLTTLMSHFPNTRRETSETEEYCRLVFPLAVLYDVTKETEHYEWLCHVVNELEKFRHPSGGYAEWDTDYKAGCSRNHKGECALLADNGDPVADLLYSNNWLPLGFSYAYFVTGERRFAELWLSHAGFIASTQMHSDSPTLNGAWARAFDMSTRENCGMPHDLGWGPYCIESGWSIGEILIGLQFMRIAEKKYQSPSET